MKLLAFKHILIFMFFMTTRCSSYVSNIDGQSFAPVDPPIALASPEPANGAIFHSSQNGLFATDQRARRVGDILTVSFNETYSATKAQTASSTKTDNFGVTLPTGLPNILTGGFDKDAGGNGAGLSAGTTQSFAGGGNAVAIKNLLTFYYLKYIIYIFYKYYSNILSGIVIYLVISSL